MNSGSHYVGLLVAAITIAAPIVSYFIVFKTVARLSGWTELAREYLCIHEPQGVRSRWTSLGTFRIGGYNNCVRFIASEKGLFVALHKPFHAFHPPLLIPWGDLRKTGEGKSFGYPYTEIEMPTADKRRWKLLTSVLGPAIPNGWLK